MSQYASSFLAKLIKLLAIFLLFNTQVANSKDKIELKLDPKQCVSLREGQECFATAELSWHAINAGEYCLYSSLQEQALQCWQSELSGYYKSKVVLTKDLIFTIRNRIDSTIEASVGMELAWVYKKNSRSKTSWRMF